MKIEILESIVDLPSEEWANISSREFPFLDYRFLQALEVTGCLGARTGWSPRYLCVYDHSNQSDEKQKLIGAMVCFVKTNSYGEYIFDFAWANAYENYGLSYYPKMVSAVPFTPATGPKLLISVELSEPKAAEVKQALLKQLLQLTGIEGLSSTHALFITEGEKAQFEAAGFFIRHSFQYHWQNPGFQSFTQFLGELRSKRRKEILRERQQVKQSGLILRRLSGAELNDSLADSMSDLYLSTVDKRGGFNYLTSDFFKEVFRTMPEHILLVTAQTAEGQIVAGALNYFGSGTLYGRHWGCLDEYRALHFELCYYQGIEFAIEKNLRLFEAGAQGEHKFQRGFLPRLTYSAHHMEEPQMNSAIKDFAEREKYQMKQLFREYEEQSPFHRESGK